MKLDCYALSENPPALVSARPTREWMDRFHDRHAYRCLPLSIANTYGWEVQSPCSFEVRWNGGLAAKDISFHALDDFRWLSNFVASNFTHGVVTFHTGYLFRTEPGWNLLATGPFNLPKDGIHPLSGVIETDWLPYPFTMNWQLTRPGTVRWLKDEPFCMLFPVQQGAIQRFVPTVYDINDNTELRDQYHTWRDNREEFMERYRAGDPATLKQAWQRYYFVGKLPNSDSQIPSHATKIRLDDPIDKRTHKD